MKRLLKFLAALMIVLFCAGLTVYLQPLWLADQIIRVQLWREKVSSRYTQVDGYRIHYFEAAAPGGGGTPLVLVHGLGSRGEDWSPLIPTLAASGFHVYAPDLLGYGRSPKPDVDYSISLQEKTVVDFMKTMHLDHADVGGWSMGGWVALKLTVDHPELVDRLVVYDAAGIYFPATYDGSLFTPKDPSELAELSAMLTPAPKQLPAFVARAAVDRLQRNAWVIRRSVDSMTGGRDLLDFRLHEIRKPALIVWGKQDTLIPLSVGETMHRDIAGSSILVVDGCGHLAPGECMKPVLQGTVKFLKSQPAMSGQEMQVQGRVE